MQEENPSDLNKKMFKGQEMKKVIIGTLLVFSINIQANIIEAVVMGVVEVAMPFVIDGNLKSENERKANAAQAQSQWKKFTSFLGFTDKKRKIVHMQEVNTTDWSEEADWGEE